jgi:aspartate aminotransferase-like enzyme
MILKATNLSTGPVGITRQVQKALQEHPLSHRSTAFRNLYDQTAVFLSYSFNVSDTYLLTGSGTLANEVMLQEIKCVEGKGLILSNGEFGNRLIAQAKRSGLDFLTYKLDWGKAFKLATIEKLLSDHSVKWLLCCHCETSTGIVVDLKKLTGLAYNYNCLCFVDCMSTVGTAPLDLSKVAMATASSGKGLASIPGLAIIFSNIEPTIKSACPIYLDLYHYKTTAGIPFTIPSNLLNALYISVQQKLQEEQYELITEYRKIFFNTLNDASLVPFSNEHTSVFTIVPPESLTRLLISCMRKHHLLMSYESDYLKSKRWYQLATFGYYTEKQLKQVSNALSLFANTSSGKKIVLF